MNRRLFFALAAAGLLAPAFAHAQPERFDPGEEEMMGPPRGEHKGDHGDMMLKMLDKHLKLKPEQRKKVEKILEDGQPEMQKIRKEMQAIQERMRKASQRQSEKVRELLDDDQKVQFDEMNVEMRRQMEMGGTQKQGRPFGLRRRPGPPSEDEDRFDLQEMGPRDLPPPEMWHDGGKRPEKPERPDRPE